MFFQYYFHYFLLLFTDVFLFYSILSTKDPGQKPFSFQVGLGKVIKG